MLQVGRQGQRRRLVVEAERRVWRLAEGEKNEGGAVTTQGARRVAVNRKGLGPIPGRVKDVPNPVPVEECEHVARDAREER